MNQFKAIESVRMRAKRTKRKKEMGEKIDPGQARLGGKMGQLVVYTSLCVTDIFWWKQRFVLGLIGFDLEFWLVEIYLEP